MVLILGLQAGCVDPAPYDATMACTESSAPIHPEDATLGYSADDALALLQAGAPSDLVWDDLWLVEQEPAFQMSISAGEGDPELVTRAQEGPGPEAACRVGPELRVWVDLSVELGDGIAAGSAEVPVDVAALDLSAVHLDAVSVPLTLRGSYAEAADAAVRSEWGEDARIDGIRFTPRDLWSDGDVSVVADLSGPDLNAVTTLWRGSWSLP